MVVLTVVAVTAENGRTRRTPRKNQTCTSPSTVLCSFRKSARTLGAMPVAKVGTARAGTAAVATAMLAAEQVGTAAQQSRYTRHTLCTS